MSQKNANDQNHTPQGEELNPAEPQKTPLELVKEQQSMKAHNLEIAQGRPDLQAEVPGQGIPSDRRHHPQRQMYGSGTDES